MIVCGRWVWWPRGRWGDVCWCGPGSLRPSLAWTSAQNQTSGNYNKQEVEERTQFQYFPPPTGGFSYLQEQVVPAGLLGVYVP